MACCLDLRKIFRGTMVMVSELKKPPPDLGLLIGLPLAPTDTWVRPQARTCDRGHHAAVRELTKPEPAVWPAWSDRPLVCVRLTAGSPRMPMRGHDTDSFFLHGELTGV